MANSDAEISTLQKRLEEVEKAIQELRGWQLGLTKTQLIHFCRYSYEVYSRSFRGEELLRYTSVWSKKVNETEGQITAAQSLEDAVATWNKFWQEHSDYVAAKKVQTEREAMDIAHDYIKKYSPVALPLKAVKEDAVWVVDLDIGAFATKIAKVKVDARTGEILGHEIPEK